MQVKYRKSISSSFSVSRKESKYFAKRTGKNRKKLQNSVLDTLLLGLTPTAILCEFASFSFSAATNFALNFCQKMLDIFDYLATVRDSLIFRERAKETQILQICRRQSIGKVTGK